MKRLGSSDPSFFSLSKNLVEFRRARRKNADSFCPGACTSDKTLYVLQVWNLCACGTQIMRAAGCKPFQTGNQQRVSRLRACQKHFFDTLNRLPEQCPGRRFAYVLSRATPRNSAGAFDERFCSKIKLGKRGIMNLPAAGAEAHGEFGFCRRKELRSAALRSVSAKNKPLQARKRLLYPACAP